MIDSISSLASQQILGNNLIDHAKKHQESLPASVEFPSGIEGFNKTGETKTFNNVIGDLIHEVDAKNKVSIAEANKVMLGQTDNIHQAMIASQEAGLAFTTMVEVRNKLIQSYQELIKMPV